MDLSMAIGENFSYSQNNFLDYNLQLQPSHINLKLFIYSFVLLTDQLTLMSFIASGAFTGTQTFLEITRDLTIPSELFVKL